MHHDYGQRLQLQRDELSLTSELFFTSFQLLDLQKIADTFLHSDELHHYQELKFPRRQLSYLLGRYAAKNALKRLIVTPTKLTDILIEYGVFKFPVVNCPTKNNVQVSWSHTGNACMALAFPEIHPMGIDLEKHDSEKNSVIASQLTREEITMINQYRDQDGDKLMTVFWTVKEALSKILRTGMMLPFEILTIKQIVLTERGWVSEFAHFSQYHALSFVIGDMICSLVYPKKTSLTIDITFAKKLNL